MRSEAQSLGQLPPNSKERRKDHGPNLADLQSESRGDPDSERRPSTRQEHSIFWETVWESGYRDPEKISLIRFCSTAACCG